MKEVGISGSSLRYVWCPRTPKGRNTPGEKLEVGTIDNRSREMGRSAEGGSV